MKSYVLLKTIPLRKVVKVEKLAELSVFYAAMPNSLVIVNMVARDGYPQHTTLFSIPLTDVFLDPKLDLRWTNGVC